MQLVCTCGNTMEFYNTRHVDDTYGESNDHVCLYDGGKFALTAEHDEIWMTCMECGESIKVYT